MSITREAILAELDRIELPDGRSLTQADFVRALSISKGDVRFVLEVPADIGPRMEPVRAAAEELVEKLDGVTTVQVVMTSASLPASAPNLKVGRHPDPSANKITLPDVEHIVLVGSGKGGVGKSTLTANLAIALQKTGLKVGLLDADIYGPSQPMMLGVDKRPASPDGKEIIPIDRDGLTFMSLGLMLDPNQAVVWRGPMLMGALQQMLGQVAWGALDILLIDLPPGTGDVQLTLAQKADVSGAVIVSTPQDVALLDARKAMAMFEKLNVPLLGMVENMSSYHCPKCGHEAHIFGHGGIKAEAEKLGLPFLGGIPLDLDIRLASDAGTPIAGQDHKAAKAYDMIAKQVVSGLTWG